MERTSLLRAALGTTKRLGTCLFFFVVVVAIATAVAVQVSGDDEFVFTRPSTLVNDVTQMNPTYVGRVVEPTSIDEVVEALRSSSGPVSIGGGRFSQGGQISYPDSLHLDMRKFNRVVDLDVEHKRITVQSGITWRQIQSVIDPQNLSIRIMQTYSNFTVGGSLSVNVHGRYIGEGPLVRSVESIKLVLADGSVVEASQAQNQDLYYGAIGGYGGLGVIVEATLSLADDQRIERKTSVMPVSSYRQFFAESIRDNRDVVFHNADLYPPDFTTSREVSWYKTQRPVTIEDRTLPEDMDYVWQPRIASWVGGSGLGKWTRQHVIEPVYYLEDRVVWRNWEASYDVHELEPASRDEQTYGLREYFIPVDRFDEFVPRMREIFNKYEANVLNVSVRHALPDPGTLLAWANKEVFAFVVYYRQGRTPEEIATVRNWSVAMIDAATALGGSYYLPYQIFESPEQFHKAYPRATEYFALKDRVDPENRFRNRLWQQLYPANRDALESRRQATPDYYRGEAQTVLTVPEWYLVFNPVEYAQYLGSGKDPSSFPFFDSIDEYWTLYDRAIAVARVSQYPKNGEYMTMLRVIGVSTTAEYLLKGLYEGTVGKLTRWTANDADTAEDVVYAKAQDAYAKFIFDRAWYEFDFARWIGTMWTEAPFLGDHLLRKLERRLFFTLEFGFKSAYAKLIGFASHSTYGEKSDRIYMTVIAPQDDTTLPVGVEQLASDGRSRLVSTLRWGPFTEASVQLAEAGYRFQDISGNRRIVVSAVGPSGQKPPPMGASLLFTSEMVADPTLERHVLLVQVGQLSTFLQELNASSLRLEHIYDY